MKTTIPAFDTARLIDGSADRALAVAAADIGFVVISGPEIEACVGPDRRSALSRVFGLPEQERRAIALNIVDPSRPIRTHGWIALREDHQTCFEGIELGPDIAHGARAIDEADPLRRPTPVPSEDALPGWRSLVREHYLAMERVGTMLMTSLARGLGLNEDTFTEPFDGGLSSLRLLRYPVRDQGRATGKPDALQAKFDATQPPTGLGEHVDFGCVTLLAQDGVAGLQARSLTGGWVDVPPTEGTLAVNFGRLLELWTGGRIRATLHRVAAPGVERRSIPFFYEPKPDAVIAPLPFAAAIEPFTPFLYRDFVMDARPRLRRAICRNAA